MSAARLDVDYLVVGAGAMGMAFTDALTDHADVSVALVDRRHAPGGHWLDAYPFVRLHQSSAFYGVPSTLLGGGRVQQRGPEAGLHERATAAEVCAYYGQVLEDRMIASGRVSFHPGCDYLGDRQVVSNVSGKRYEVPERTRIVDASYLAPTIPSRTPPPFAVADGVTVVPVNELVRLGAAPSQLVVVGSGKTATDAIVWLLGQGVDPGTIRWVRPREPWMLDRARIQPDPSVFVGMAADMFTAAGEAESPDDLFLRLEDAGVVLCIDPSQTPTMAKTPTLGQWELDLLRTVDDVVRLGHVRAVEPGRLVLAEGEVAIDRDAVVVHCAAAGLQYPPVVPIWKPEVITLQTVRAGFPCLGAGLAGFVEATFFAGDHAPKNAVCPPSTYADTPAGWARQQLLGARGAAAYTAHPEVKAWAETLTMHPTRTPPGGDPPELTAARERLALKFEAGLAGLERLAAHHGG